MTIPIIIITVLVFLIVLIGAIILAFLPRKAPIQSGLEDMIGKVGEARRTLEPKGEVFIEGELWKAQSISGKIEKGEHVRVKEIKGLTLIVEKITKEDY